MSDNKSLPRQQLVASAVKFLSNPGILGTPVSSQIDFLRKKGLTQHEINSALRYMKISPSLPSNRSDSKLWLALSYYIIPGALSRASSPLGIIFGLTRAAVSLSVLLYLCYRLMGLVISMSPKLRVALTRVYVKVRLILGLEQRCETPSGEQPTEGLSLDSLQQLETCQLFEGTDVLLADPQIESIRIELSELRAKQDNNFSDLRSEIRSVRSLFLSSSQFPKPQIVPPDTSQHTETPSLQFKPSGMFHTRSMPAPNNTATKDTMDTPSRYALDFLSSLSESEPTEKPADTGGEIDSA